MPQVLNLRRRRRGFSSGLRKMSLRARLAALKEESGSTRSSVVEREQPAVPAPVCPNKDEPAVPLADSMGQQLKVRLAAASKARASSGGDCAGLAGLVGGMVVSEGLVEVVSTFALPHRYGSGRIDPAVGRDAAFMLAPGEAPQWRRLVVIDTETTGLAGGTGTLPFLTGVAVCEPHQLTVRQWLLTRFAGEEAMLARLQALLEPADLLVSYNGKCFDLPLLMTRTSLARQRSTLEALDHLDLLYSVRKAFKGLWPDCRLQTAEQRLLGHTRVDDIPGEAIPDVWFDWMRSGATAGMASVVRHNQDDLVGLTALVSSLARIFERPEQHDVSTLRVLSYAVEDKAELKQRLQASVARLDAKEVFELARLARQQGDWELAVAHWSDLSVRGHLPAIEQLAKYQEHQRYDIEAALTLTRTLIEQEGAQPRHLHREQRLLRKRSRATTDTCYDACHAPVAQ